ncbi:hypothetical protein [uncultured Luteimonas sp.]|uniref:hypothetical protein n=1 Tax=uncultured Luteimonas sp. TaxID=453144 RepID=UPI00261C4D04|nr:hypothetical protein [uncultured Luteimonas sp.]
MNDEARTLHRLAWGWMVLGALALSAGTLLSAAAWQFYRESTHTPGVVVAHQGRAGGTRDLGGRYVSSNVVPVVAYRGAGGLRARVVGSLPRDETKAPPIGGALAVRYRVLPDGTTHARIDSAFEIAGIPALLLLSGAGLAAVGWYARRVALGRQPGSLGPRHPGMEDWDRVQRTAALRAGSPARRGRRDDG